MPGYAANLVRSGARGLTTRRRSFAAATLSTMLRSTPANEPPSTEAPSAAAALTPAPPADHAPILAPSQPSVTHAYRVEISGEAPHPRLEDSSVSPPAQTSRVPEERAPAFSAAAIPPEPRTIPSAPPHAATIVTLRPGLAKEADHNTASPAEATDARGDLSAPTILLPPRLARTGAENDRQENSSASPTVATVSKKPETEILPPQPAADSTKHGFYHGRRIRVEHSTPAPNPAVARLQQRPASSTAVSGAREIAPPALRSREQTSEVPSRSTPRITAPVQANAHLPAVVGSKPETPARPSVFSVLPAATAPEPAFTPAAKRNNAREERASEGPRLSIGLLEVQIIQEPSESPRRQAPPVSPVHEHDDLERSYVRPIG